MSSKQIRLLAIVLTSVLALSETSVAFGKTMVLFSEFHGKLVDGEGTPASGVVVRRSWKDAYSNVEGSDEARTNADGAFSFPEVTTRSLLAGIVPHSPSVLQQVHAVRPDGSELLVYLLDKSNYDRDGELSGSRLAGPGIHLTFRIDKEPSDDGWFWGTCTEPR